MTNSAFDYSSHFERIQTCFRTFIFHIRPTALMCQDKLYRLQSTELFLHPSDQLIISTGNYIMPQPASTTTPLEMHSCTCSFISSFKTLKIDRCGLITGE